MHKQVDPKIYHQLSRIIGRWQGEFLPSIREISSQMGKKTETVSTALKELRKNGLVDYSQGKKIRITRTPNASTSIDINPFGSTYTSSSSRQQAVKQLRELITDGVFKAGESLPKRKHLEATLHVSGRTLSPVLKDLCEEGVIEKSGRAWKVVKKQYRKHSPCILLVQPFPQYWGHLSTPRTGGFTQAFISESEGANVNLYAWSQCNHSKDRIKNHTELRKKIQGLGTSLIGILMVGHPGAYTNFNHLVKILDKYDFPVVWFDQQQLNRRDTGLPPAIIQAVFSEQRLVREILNHLWKAGHRHIGYIGKFDVEHYGKSPKWQLYRKEMLKKESLNFKGLQVWSFDDLAPGFYENIKKQKSSDFGEKSKLFHIISYHLQGPVRNNKYPSVQELFYHQGVRWQKKQTILSQLSGMMEIFPVLLHPRVSVLLFANDAIGSMSLRLLSDMNISVPKNISVMSIDNYRDFSSFPVTTIGAGPANLGYRVFHALVRDIPAGITKNNQIIARPAISRRGSVYQI